MYGFNISVRAPFNTVIDVVTGALKKEGFGVLTTIDVKQTMKEKINLDHRPYTILGACNPQLAHQAIESEPDIGLLLPCNVVVRQEEDESITVAFMNPEAVLALVGRKDVEILAKEVRERMERVRDDVQSVITKN